MRVDGSLCLEGRRPRRPRVAGYDKGIRSELTIRAMHYFGVGIGIAIGIDSDADSYFPSASALGYDEAHPSGASKTG